MVDRKNPWENPLPELIANPSTRRQAMHYTANQLRIGRELPEVARNWLAAALDALVEDPTDARPAFGLPMGRSGPRTDSWGRVWTEVDRSRREFERAFGFLQEIAFPYGAHSTSRYSSIWEEKDTPEGQRNEAIAWVAEYDFGLERDAVEVAVRRHLPEFFELDRLAEEMDLTKADVFDRLRQRATPPWRYFERRANESDRGKN